MAYPGRVTPTELRGIAEVDSAFLDADLEIWINTANELVTEKCADILEVDGGYSAARLALIELYLSAHFYHHDRDMKAKQEGVSGLIVTYQSLTDIGLDGTHYGQNAMRLDTRGSLALMNNAMKNQEALKTINVGITHLSVDTEDE